MAVCRKVKPSETAKEDRKSGVTLKSSQSNRSLATGSKEPGQEGGRENVERKRGGWDE